jgi:hypothetical protein
MRLAIAGYSHETNSFALEQNDQLDARVSEGVEIVQDAHPKSFVGGFVEGARRHPDVILVGHLSCAYAFEGGR